MGIMNSIRFLLLFILIPIFGLSQNPNIENESDINIKFIEHNVKRKQTLFTISNLYNVPIDLIKKYNPQIKGDKISKRMVLKIPFITSSDTEKIIKETLVKPVSKSKNNKLNLFDSVPNKKNISLAFIAPFNLDKIDIDSIENTKNKSIKTIYEEFLKLIKGSKEAVNVSDIYAHFVSSLMELKSDYCQFY